MIYEAKVLGASAVLLICSILSETQIRDYIAVSDALGLSALVEAHDEAEVEMALKAGARVIGVNNRNLKDFSVDPENSRRLRRLIPWDVLFVSESGVKDANDVQAARDMGASRMKVFTSVTLPLMLPGLGNAFLVTFIESIADFANPMIIGGSYDTLATTIYLQITGAYDKAGAAAMAVVLLCITLVMFAVQKYYLEAKTAATLTGKASRARMLIEDRSVKIPLTILCSLGALFVIMMYICVPIGACFPTWGYKFFPLTGKWFEAKIGRASCRARV